MRIAKEFGMDALFPNLNDGTNKESLSRDDLFLHMTEHFKAIDSAQALYVICPEGYVGNSVRVEIGYALGKELPVYYSQESTDPVLNGLYTKIVPLLKIGNLKDL